MPGDRQRTFRSKGGRPVSDEARFRRIAEDLRKRLAAREWPSGSAIPSLRRLAKAYGEGQRTIRLAVELLKQDGLIAANARRRLVTLTASPASSAPVARKTLLLVYAKPLQGLGRRGVEADLLYGIQRGAGELEVPLTIMHGLAFRSRLPQAFLGYPVQGIVIVGPILDETLARYENLNVPVVLADHPPGSRRLHAACYDNEAGMVLAVDRLAALGHRRVAFVRRVQLASRDIEPDSKERQTAFLRRVKELGLRCEPRPVFSYMSVKRWSDLAVKSLLSERPAYTAAIAADRDVAVKLSQAAEAAGLHLPRDFSLVCFQAKGERKPDLAGPTVDFVEMGRQAVLLTSQAPAKVQLVRIPPTWNEGKSIAPAKP